MSASGLSAGSRSGDRGAIDSSRFNNQHQDDESVPDRKESRDTPYRSHGAACSRGSDIYLRLVAASTGSKSHPFSLVEVAGTMVKAVKKDTIEKAS